MGGALTTIERFEMFVFFLWVFVPYGMEHATRCNAPACFPVGILRLLEEYLCLNAVISHLDSD